MRVLLAVVTAFVLLAASGNQARAHALEPGYLELEALGGDGWRAYWRKPAVQGRPMAIDPELPENCNRRSAPAPAFDGRAWVAQWIVSCPGGLTGGVISIAGLGQTRTDVLVRYELAAGDGQAMRLTPDASSFTVPRDPGVIEIAGSYFFLGVEHILEGIDHLLFVFALLLLIPDRWRLLGAITAFTVAHSITMAAATLNVVTLPGPPVEAVIALSIMFIASELLHRDGSGNRLSERFPWIVSFSFGLLHGFGFAGALQEIGLPRSDVPLALFAFNVGVEAGQVLFILAVVLAAALVGRLVPSALRAARSPDAVISVVGAYSIGGISAYWFIDRIAGF